MLWSDGLLRVIVLILMLIAGIQDLRTRRVSNWITIPFFFAGLIANVLRYFSNLEIFQMVVLFQCAVILAGYFGWMGGADMKVFGGLLGLFPIIGIIALIASGIVGAAVWGYTGRKDAKFPAVTVVSFVAGMMFILTGLLTRV